MHLHAVGTLGRTGQGGEGVHLNVSPSLPCLSWVLLLLDRAWRVHLNVFLSYAFPKCICFGGPSWAEKAVCLVFMSGTSLHLVFSCKVQASAMLAPLDPLGWKRRKWWRQECWGSTRTVQLGLWGLMLGEVTDLPPAGNGGKEAWKGKAPSGKASGTDSS